MYLLNLDRNFCPQGFNNNWLEVNAFTFNGGENHIQITRPTNPVVDRVIITHRLTSAERMMQLILAADAVKRMFEDVKVEAIIPYFPGARQDRQMNGGEPFTLKVMANLVNSCNFNKVHILEPHSDVTMALVENSVEMDMHYLRSTYLDIKANYGEPVVLAPDGGALKRVFKRCERAGYTGEVYDCSKLRKVATGDIIRTTVNAPREAIEGQVVWIQDDICSRGGTFIALSKILKDLGAKHVVLSVAHYEGVAEMEAIQKSGIDRIYTTNSMGDTDFSLVKRWEI